MTLRGLAGADQQCDGGPFVGPPPTLRSSSVPTGALAARATMTMPLFVVAVRRRGHLLLRAPPPASLSRGDGDARDDSDDDRPRAIQDTPTRMSKTRIELPNDPQSVMAP